MKRIRFALFLPLLHLAIITPSFLIREAKVWKYAPIAQQERDYEQMHPGDTGRLVVEPCYEYRFSNASRVIFATNLPAALLIGTPDGCPRSALELASDGAKLGISVKNEIILRGSLIVLGILAQWWLVGRWLDHQRRQLNRVWLYGVPVAIVTLAGTVMVPTAFFSAESAELVNIISVALALLAWIVLVGMFLASGVAWGFKKIGKQARNVTNSHA